MTIIRTGYPFYGQNMGVLVFSTVTPRIPGDAGNCNSFTYPIRYEIVHGDFTDLIKGSDKIKEDILAAGRRLVDNGIRGIIGDCGLMSLYQEDMGGLLGIPFAGSSLCQIPTVWELIGRSGTIGIITGHSELLSKRHLESSGWREDIRLWIQGMQDEPHFREIVINGGLDLDVEAMRNDILCAAEKLKSKTKDLRAVVIECSNLATYSADLVEFLKLPVFDTISAANLVEYAVNPNRYI